MCSSCFPNPREISPVGMNGGYLEDLDLDDEAKNYPQSGLMILGGIVVEPGYDPTKRGGRCLEVCISQVCKGSFEQPTFWTGEKFAAEGGKDFWKCILSMLVCKI
ncbi:hypothetical protein Adt_14497 [Abeliophyllum distichum]|uniref:Uncharacterized protein n=1 Tax=Abeliophyllum distichum TaxID=126358 RepID=A0ABD1TZU8_9LAMI